MTTGDETAPKTCGGGWQGRVAGTIDVVDEQDRERQARAKRWAEADARHRKAFDDFQVCIRECTAEIEALIQTMRDDWGKPNAA